MVHLLGIYSPMVLPRMAESSYWTFLQVRIAVNDWRSDHWYGTFTLQAKSVHKCVLHVGRLSKLHADTAKWPTTECLVAS
jgi:hypothetical protein